MTHNFDIDIDEEIVSVSNQQDAAVVWAFSRVVDGIATITDLEAMRGWIVRLRLTGTAEEDLHTTTLVADDLARKLGVA